MILLDTHTWVWWATGNPRLPPAQAVYLAANESQGVLVSVISCWEVALLVSRGRLAFTVDVETWIMSSLQRPHVALAPLTPEVAVEANRLPGAFHRDPADQIIVATARLLNCPLMTSDARILTYPHVRLAP